MRGLALSAALVANLVALGASATARADEDRVPWTATKPGYVHLLATSFVGDGLRFNNPYRLATPLGSDAESISRTASYVDFGLAATLGDPLGVQHGAALRVSRSIEGVPQWVAVPSYLVWRRWRSWAAYGRAGVAVVTLPDVTWGMEVSVGGAYFVRGGIGIATEVVGDVIYGEGTSDVRVATYPLLSAQLGIVVAYEVLP